MIETIKMKKLVPMLQHNILSCAVNLKRITYLKMKIKNQIQHFKFCVVDFKDFRYKNAVRII